MTETIRYSLIAKEDIKLEPRDGTFQVTLADGRVVILSALDVAYLLSDAFAKGSLPGASVGQLARVTDDMRGLWMKGPGDWWRVGGHVLDVREFGAKADDATDDAAAIQLAIDAAGDTTAYRAGVTVLVSGRCAIGSTLLIRRRGITFAGTGWAAQATGPGSHLRWIGSAGSPMVRIQDTAGGVRVADLQFVGDASQRPDSAISLLSTAQDGGNVFHRFENLLIGALGEGDATIQFAHGIRVEQTGQGATLTDNAQIVYRNVQIRGVSTAGLRLGHARNWNHVLLGFYVMGANYGIWTSGHVVGDGVFVDASRLADLYVPATDDDGTAGIGQIHLTGYASRDANRLAELPGHAVVSIRGGLFELSSLLSSDGKVIATRNNNFQHVHLADFRFTQKNAPPTAPFLELRSAAGGASAKYLVLDGVQDFSLRLTGSNQGLDALTEVGGSDFRYIYIREAPSSGDSTAGRVSQNQIEAASTQWDRNRFDVTRLRIGQGTTITKHLSGTATYDPPNLANGSQTTTTVSVTGAVVGDVVGVGFSQDLQGMRLTGYVSLANVVTAVLRNDTGGALDLASGTLRADVWQH